MREAWTDDRLDDLARRMDAGFDRVDRDIREVRAEMRSGFDSVNARFDAMTARLESLQRTMLRVGGALAAVVLASILANHR